jgi:Leucine-rich repeat (LRR) protein/pimeloyl-ACP methyl ester carboxylesterase
MEAIMKKRIVFFLLLLCSTNIVGANHNLSAQVSKSDSLALVALYNSTNGDNWTHNTNWLTGPVHTWYGVATTCTEWDTNGVCVARIVVGLDLYKNQLIGSIPADIGNLTSLTHLDLWGNQLTGDIPPEIGNLTSLMYLDLSNNQLTGNIPPEIGNLTNLEYLLLGPNQLTGNIPPEIGNLTSLTYLYLSNNQLTGNIPPEIGNLTSLAYLYLWDNQLTGDIPPEIGNLTNLWRLGLSSNQLTGNIPPEIGNLTKLEYLLLGPNQLTGNIPPEIGNLTSLTDLYLSSNQLTGNIPPEIANLTSLAYLYLWGNQLTGDIPPEIGNLTNLEDLALGHNQLTGNIPPEIGNLTSLTHLDLWDNQLTGDIPPEICNLTSLAVLEISDNSFVNLPDLSPIATLQNLWIEYNQFTFEDIEPNVGVPTNVFVYSPQDSVGSTQDTTVSLGDSLTLKVSVGGTANLYQWMKDGFDIPGANDSLYTIDTVTFADSGSYVCRITNTIATELTLYSRPINVSVEGPAVILIHGYKGSNESWGKLDSLLQSKGRKVKFFSYQGTDIPIETLAVRLKNSLEAWNDELKINERGVDLVAHSMGGLIARYYITHYPNHVKKLITLATPHYGTFAANQAWFFLQGSIQSRQQELGSRFLWDLYHASGASPYDSADKLCIVGTWDNNQFHAVPCLFASWYESDPDHYDDMDGLIPVNSANLESFGVPTYYVPKAHTGGGLFGGDLEDGIVYITDETHPSYQPIASFLGGQIPTTPKADDIGDPNHAEYSEIGAVILSLMNEAGDRVPIEYVNWPPGALREKIPCGSICGRNDNDSLYFAGMVEPGIHNIVVGPNIAGYSPVPTAITIHPHRTDVYEFITYPADASATNNFAGGDAEPQVFGNTGVTMDFSSGPGGTVSVYRFDDPPPGTTKSATLPHYWDVDSDFSDSSFLVTITFDYDESEVLASGLAEAELKIAYYDTLWHPMTTNVDMDNNQVSVTSDHFSLFAIGSFTGTGIEEEPEVATLPSSSGLSQNYPNPFNPSTTIKYQLKGESPSTKSSMFATLKIFNIRGQLVRTLVNEEKLPGSYSVIWDGKDQNGKQVASGVYFYRLEAGDYQETKRMVLLK